MLLASDGGEKAGGGDVYKRAQGTLSPCAGSGGSLDAHTPEFSSQVRSVPTPAPQMLLVETANPCHSLGEHPSCSEWDRSPHRQADAS